MAQEGASLEDIRAMVRIAGHELTDQQLEDLVAGYRLYEPVLARLPRDLPLSAEPAHIFDPQSFMPKDARR